MFLYVVVFCGYLDIVRYFLSYGVNIVVVNSDGDLFLDLVELDVMEGLLKVEIIC